MIFGPLTGGSFNPARWFGPALVGNDVRRHLALRRRPDRRRAHRGVLYRFVIAAGPRSPTPRRLTSADDRDRAAPAE